MGYISEPKSPVAQGMQSREPELIHDRVTGRSTLADSFSIPTVQELPEIDLERD